MFNKSNPEITQYLKSNEASVVKLKDRLMDLETSLPGLNEKVSFSETLVIILYSFIQGGSHPSVAIEIGLKVFHFK